MPDAFDHLCFAMMCAEEARRYVGTARGREEAILAEYHRREANSIRLRERNPGREPRGQ